MQHNHALQLRIHSPNGQDDPFRGYPAPFVQLGHNILRQYENGDYRFACMEVRVALEAAIQEYFGVRGWVNGGDLNYLLSDRRLKKVLKRMDNLDRAVHYIRVAGNKAVHPLRNESDRRFFQEYRVRNLINYVLLAYDALLKRDRPTGSCWSVVK